MKGWRTQSLGDVCHVYQPETIAQKALRAGPYPVYGANGQIGWHDTPNHQESELLLGCRGSVGSIHQTSGPAWINGNAMVVRPLSGVMDRDFLAYALSGGVDITASITGAAQPQITRTSLSPIAISYPVDINEQRRIVTILDEVFEGIATAKANAEKNLQNAREVFEGHLQDVFDRDDEEWRKTTISEATGGVFTGPFGSLLHKSDYIEDGIPLVNPAHISDGGIEPDYRKSVSEATAERLSNYVLRTGDIVIGRRGEMGRCAVVTDAEDGWLCGTGSFVIRSGNQCDARFLVRLLRSRGCKKRLEAIAGGAVMPNLSNTDLGNFEIRLPPLGLQLAVLEKVEALAGEVQRLEGVYQRKLTALDELKKSLLHQAFTGQLSQKDADFSEAAIAATIGA